MYNEIQKKEYLDFCDSTNRYGETTISGIKSIFNNSALVEERWEKDLCYFNRPQIIDLLKSYNSLAPDRLKQNCVYLADYYNWCLNVNHYVSDLTNYYHYSLSDEIIDGVIDKEDLLGKYFNKEEMKKYTSKIYDPTNQYIAYALYNGIKGDNFEELIHVKPEDLDRDKKELTLITERKIIVDDYFIELMDKADAAEKYDEEGAIKDNPQDYYSFIPNGYVLKQMKRGGANPLTIPSIQRRLRVIKEQSGNKFLTAAGIWKNGLINHIIERHREFQPDITFQEIMFHEINAKLYTHDKKTKEYIKEYGAKIEVKMLRNDLKGDMEYFD